MDRRQLLWQMTSMQFAAFDVQLYLDTHPGDKHALGLFNDYRKSHAQAVNEYERMSGPISAGTAGYDSWRWVGDPWPWEREAN